MVKKVIDILGIVLPALIIILGITRLFVKKTKGFNSLTILFALLLLIGGAIRYLFYPDRHNNNPDADHKLESIRVSSHSEAFNLSMEKSLNAYFKMTEAFVNWDTSAIRASGNELKAALDSFNIDELKKDSAGIYESAVDPLANARTEAGSILADPSILEKRGSFNILSENLRLLITAVKYDGAVLYWQECPSAFGEDRPGNWLSKTKDARNPYQGTKDPEFGSRMLNCGSSKYTLQFDPPPADTTKKQ